MASPGSPERPASTVSRTPGVAPSPKPLAMRREQQRERERTLSPREEAAQEEPARRATPSHDREHFSPGPGKARSGGDGGAAVEGKRPPLPSRAVPNSRDPRAGDAEPRKLAGREAGNARLRAFSRESSPQMANRGGRRLSGGPMEAQRWRSAQTTPQKQAAATPRSLEEKQEEQPSEETERLRR